MNGSSDSGQESLVKVAAPIRSGSHSEREMLWARPLGGALFEVRNLSWLRDDIHHLDVVRCRENESGTPEIVDVVAPSGHDTLPLIFTEHAGDNLREKVLELVERRLGYTERAAENAWAVDVNPGNDLPGVLEYLGRLQADGYLEGKPE